MKQDRIRRKYLGLFHKFTQLAGKIDFLDVSRKEFMVLELIHRLGEDDKVITIRDIADRMQVSSPAVSRMIGALAKDKLVEKQVLAADRRNTYIVLTKKGLEVVEHCERRLCRISDEVLEAIGSDEVWELAKGCEQLLDAFESAIQAERIRQEKTDS